MLDIRGMMPLRRKATVVLLVSMVCLQIRYFYSHRCESTETKVIQRSLPERYTVEIQNETNFLQDFKEQIHPGGEDAKSASPFKDTLVYPVPRREKGFLTIGIPTVKRKGTSYILQTVSSLSDNMSPEEKKEVLIVVFLADTDPGIRRSLADEIKSHFKEYVETGMLHLIQAPTSYYPDFETNKTTYRQTKTYVKWRAKQCYDYAYMLEYSIDLSTYYMQLEDDVVASKGYIGAIKDFMKKQPKKFWVCLEFSELGFIGKLYRSTDLKQLADLLKLFYIEQPVDVTFIYFNMLSTQMSPRLRKPTLFQHKGIISSSPRGIQKLQDRFYNGSTEDIGSNIPSADVVSSIVSYSTYYPRFAYKGGDDEYFWSRGPPRKGDTITVIFHEKHRLSHVVVHTGNSFHPKDRLYNGELLVGFSLKMGKKTPVCFNMVTVGKFKGGQIEANKLEESIMGKVECLVIKVTKKQKNWLIVRDIIVNVLDSTLNES